MNNVNWNWTITPQQFYWLNNFNYSGLPAANQTWNYTANMTQNFTQYPYICSYYWINTTQPFTNTTCSTLLEMDFSLSLVPTKTQPNGSQFIDPTVPVSYWCWDAFWYQE